MSAQGHVNAPSPIPAARPSSRSSVRSLGRSASPVISFTDDTVAVRNQISTLRHSIRHQQAQLQSLENTLLRGPRPLPPGFLSSPPILPDELDELAEQSSSSMSQTQKRDSFEVLHGLAGPDSSLPLPRREKRRSSFGDAFGIREGIPVASAFGKRTASPTRTLSRIPVSSVGNARALAEEGQQDSSHAGAAQLSPNAGASTSALSSAVSPSRRSSFAPGNTTKVLADLQAGVLNARNALENTKAQLRQSQRQVSQLTRQTEDLKDVRERLRLENEGLNNVVARKERMLQEVLERARKAEAEVNALKSQLKLETTNSKKSQREMDSTVTEATARSQKAEREYIVLRDSLKGLEASFQADVEGVREEMRRREDKIRQEAEQMAKRYAKLVEEVKKERAEGGAGMGEVTRLKAENERIRKELEEAFKDDIQQLRTEVEKSVSDSEQAWRTAQSLADELAHLRRLMRAGPASASALDTEALDTEGGA